MRAELYPVRNVHQAFGYGLLGGPGCSSGLTLADAGPMAAEDLPGHAGHERMQTLGAVLRLAGRAHARRAMRRRSTGKLTFDKVTNVHYSGTAHDEDQPPHLLVHTDVCSTICGPEYGHPCTRFCPANVYEIVHDAAGHPPPADQRLELRALQDVRHHGSLPGHHLGAARGRRRSAVQRHVEE